MGRPEGIRLHVNDLNNLCGVCRNVPYDVSLYLELPGKVVGRVRLPKVQDNFQDSVREYGELGHLNTLKPLLGVIYPASLFKMAI